MTFYDFLSAGALILAIGVNTITIYLQKTRGLYDRFGKNAGRVHGIIISIFWGLFIISEFLISNSSWRIAESYAVVGALVMSLALVIFIAAIKQIGFQALGNGNFFGSPTRKLKGVYNYIPEPIYVSYTVWFLGIGLITAQKGFFVLAILSIVGLIGVESRVEQK